MSRARVAGRLAPVLERAFAVAGAPLAGIVVPVASGPGAGLRLVGERRSLAWISGGVERDVQEILASHLAPGGVFVDVGASVGFFSLLGARLVGPTGHVIAFEPQPVAAASIRRNAELNSFAQIAVVEGALSDASGTGVLEGASTATAHIASEVGAGAGLPVDLLSLDGYLAEHPALAPDLVKIDVEGHEMSVLAGMRATLADRRPAIVVELHGSPKDIVHVLEEAGYAVSVVGAEEGVAAREAEPSAHLIARPPRAIVD